MSGDRADESWMDEANVGRSARRLRIAAWVIAIVVFELTADPSLVVVVGCSKFGWEHVLTAFWLRRTDPDRARGRACLWLYSAWGVWRVSLVATMLMFAIVFAMEALRNALGLPPRKPGDGPPTQFMVAFLTAFFGFALSTILTVVGVRSAASKRVRVWVGPEAIKAREARLWPPIGDGYGTNRVHALAVTAIPFAVVLFVLPGSLLAFWVAYFFVSRLLPMDLAIVSGGVALVVAVIYGLGWVLVRVGGGKSNMAAASPAEGWPPDQDVRFPSSSQSMFGSAFR